MFYTVRYIEVYLFFINFEKLDKNRQGTQDHKDSWAHKESRRKAKGVSKK